MSTVSAKTGQPFLVMTGKRRRGRHLIEIDGQPVWLTSGLFTILCELIRARAETRAGLMDCSPVTIWRLRQAIDEGVGKRGVGHRLVETGSASAYQIGLKLEAVALDPSFRELPCPFFLSDLDKQAMLSQCRQLD